jgi:pyruvate, water dikinase
MPSILHRIKKLFFVHGPSQDELKEQFHIRYRCFKTLLTANNAALSAMAELEQALISGATYSMAMIRSRSTIVMVNVYKMVCSLIEMADGGYRELEKVFENISKEVEVLIERMPEEDDGPWVFALSDIDARMADRVGEKMANLGEAARLPGIRIPAGFVMTAAASRYFIAANNLIPEINRLKQLLDPEDMEQLYETSATIQRLISNSTLPEDLEKALLAAYDRLEQQTRPGITVAMRSSALGEDLARASFAGQYHTELSVDPEFLGRTYKEVVASKYTSRAIVYRLKNGFRHSDIEMCVGCLAMIDGSVSGVTYSREPADPGSPWLVVNCVAGAAGKVVDGTAKPLRLLVLRGEPQWIYLHERDREGAREQVPGPFLDGRLQAAQVEALARLALQLERHFAVPQDIEWSIDNEGTIFVLQTRPLAFAKGIVGGEGVSGPEDADVLFRGVVTASPGVACGPVCVVASAVDILRFPENAVLVVEHPLPDWAPLLGRAAALIASTGSEAGHLATVAREFGIPALFGVPDAVGKLACGMVVTVDATGRRIHKGRREDLLEQAAAAPDLMAGSPVQTVLKQVLAHMSPLNLTDPGSVSFKPSCCETLHDITRFCHEKSVSEMFAFGSRKGVDERAAKRLMGEVALDWWVINLGDGFRPGTDLKSGFVHIEDIVSIPMRAIWDGMDAFAWGGPPVVDVKGMGSILYQSMMHPGLDPAVPSRMAGKNYFLISRNFCNLSVRLGYHFAMIEAYLSDLTTEGYISFTFKGGAADDARRAARIRLLSDILARYDFRVEVKGDAMSARIERRPLDFLCRHLKILGYLIMHARQIDMVMNNRARADGYMEKFLAEIATFV